MADKTYELKLSLSDGSTVSAGTFIAPQGPQGDPADETAVNALNEQVDYISSQLDLYDPTKVVGLRVNFETNTKTRLCGASGKNLGTDFDVFPVFNRIKRCTVDNVGNVIAWQGDSNFVTDGTNGQVMVYIPAVYYKVVPVVREKNTDSGAIGYHLTEAKYFISHEKEVGFKLHPAFYDKNGKPLTHIFMSAYEGSMWDASQSKYLVYGTDGQQQYDEGDMACSLPGMSITNSYTYELTETTAEMVAQNRGENWHSMTVQVLSLVQLLMAVECGSFNMQEAFYFGVFGDIDSPVLTGSTASLGNASGQASSSVSRNGTVITTHTDDHSLAISYRGIENPYGNIWEFVNGANIWGDGSKGNGQVYICNDFNFDANKHDENYTSCGFTIAPDGYGLAFGWSESCDWLFVPSKGAGTAGTLGSGAIGDYVWAKEEINQYCSFRQGGVIHNNNLRYGLFAYSFDADTGATHGTTSFRLICVPTAET